VENQRLVEGEEERVEVVEGLVGARVEAQAGPVPAT
jgi:hypothetical protein